MNEDFRFDLVSLYLRGGVDSSHLASPRPSLKTELKIPIYDCGNDSGKGDRFIPPPHTTKLSVLNKWDIWQEVLKSFHDLNTQ